MFAMKAENDTPQGPTMEDMEEFARQNGYTIQPLVRRDTERHMGGYQSGKNNQSPTQMDKSGIKCWHCGNMGNFFQRVTK